MNKFLNFYFLNIEIYLNIQIYLNKYIFSCKHWLDFEATNKFWCSFVQEKKYLSSTGAGSNNL